jgi:5-oxoprolinase (ATP-hydrolysing) subunit A
MSSIDLNADLGEGIGDDEALLELVSSASIACGGHAGTAESIRRMLGLCKEQGVRAGAHPSYPDTANFGRLRLVMPLDQLIGQLRSQLLLIRTIGGQVGVPISYVKLHGALANQTAEELPLAVGVFGALQAMDPDIAVLALDASAQVRAARAVGLRVELEAYADRAYQPNGLLVPRSAEGAVLHDAEEIAARCLRLAQDGEIVAVDGTVLTVGARSICIHGDNPEALGIARAVRAALEKAGVSIAAPGESNGDSRFRGNDPVV